MDRKHIAFIIFLILAGLDLRMSVELVNMCVCGHGQFSICRSG